ncbi:MAG: glycosyltransferase [Chloroflexi bacterium]|nr:glycosyltransferase [Chloroflexota bacterium]
MSPWSTDKESTVGATPVVSVLLLTWNSQHFIRQCLDSVLTGASEISREVIVVDNGSLDGSPDILQGFNEITLIRNERNRGVAAARNQGILRARGEYVLLLDIDAVLTAGSLGKLVSFMARSPAAGLVGPKLISPDGSLQYSCRRFPTLLSKLARRIPQRWARDYLSDEELRWWAHDAISEVDYVIGACQLIRRSIFEVVGLLDERIFYGPEDVDFCLRLWKAGKKVYYAPEAVVVHHEQRITRNLRSPVTRRHLWALLYFFLKYRYGFSREPVYRWLSMRPQTPVWVSSTKSQ